MRNPHAFRKRKIKVGRKPNDITQGVGPDELSSFMTKQYESLTRTKEFEAEAKRLFETGEKSVANLHISFEDLLRHLICERQLYSQMVTPGMRKMFVDAGLTSWVTWTQRLEEYAGKLNLSPRIIQDKIKGYEENLPDGMLWSSHERHQKLLAERAAGTTTDDIDIDEDEDDEGVDIEGDIEEGKEIIAEIDVEGCDWKKEFYLLLNALLNEEGLSEKALEAVQHAQDVVVGNLTSKVVPPPVADPLGEIVSTKKAGRVVATEAGKPIVYNADDGMGDYNFTHGKRVYIDETVTV
jgi:hypothetical protein